MNRTRSFTTRACTSLSGARLSVLLLALLLGALPVRAQSGITFQFDNVQTTSQGLTFDVVAAAQEPGTKLGDLQVYLDYNESGFGALAQANGRLSASLGPELSANGSYGAPLLNDNEKARASLVTEFVGEPDQGLALTEAPVVVFHVEMLAAEGGEAASIAFHEPLMAGQQFASDLATPFAEVAASDLLEIELSLSSDPVLSASTAGENAVMLNWTTPTARQAAGFELEHAAGPDAAFTRVGEVKSADVLEDVPEDGKIKEGASYAYLLDGLELGTHRFRVRQVASDGTVSYSEEVEVRVEMVEQFRLDPAYPNPFNPTAHIRFAVRESEEVQAVLYNALGQQVQLLYDGTPPASTYQTVRIDGSNLASGLYFVLLRGKSFVSTQRVMLLK